MKLNLGCGEWKLDGWVNVDLPAVDLAVFPWPWTDGSADTILLSHVLEHFERAVAHRVLNECWRILKVGGMLSIAVPDMDKFIDAKLYGHDLDGYKWADLNYFMGGDETEMRPEQRHRYMWCHTSLWCTLEHFTRFGQFYLRGRPETFDNPDYAHISLYMDAVK